MISTTARHAESTTATASGVSPAGGTALSANEIDARIAILPPMDAAADPAAAFVRLSVELTGFAAYDLQGTGQVEAHLATTGCQVGHGYLLGLLAGEADTGDLGPRVRMAVLGAITKLWYGGAWMALPENIYGALNVLADGELAPNITYVPSVEAYRHGLMWKAFDGHPMGANPPGFGSWSRPPAPEPGPSQQAEASAESAQ